MVVWIILAASCGHKVQARLPGAPPEHELLYRARLEATGKRLQKATDKQLMHFAKHPLWLHRVASIRCISPSHFFLSPRNRSYNWEEFEPRESEPVGVIEALSTVDPSKYPAIEVEHGGIEVEVIAKNVGLRQTQVIHQLESHVSTPLL